ncbi:MAG TPA: glycine amidinotransferase [Thermoanaerobaculia bacterium]|nr:glycine amidinotransferase [Thermoanaerobaculia bacterium]
MPEHTTVVAEETASGKAAAEKKWPVVNSHNYWSPLEEIIVGTSFHLDYSEDLSFKLFFHQNLYNESTLMLQHDPPSTAFSGVKPSNRLRDELQEDTEGFIDILKQAGVSVRRPQAVTEALEVKTPSWNSIMGHGLMSRDLFIVIGNEIIETAPMLRSRYFEADLYKELFTEYFNAGAKWTVAPRSRLQDRNFDFCYVLANGYKGEVPDDPFFEIMFDGAQIVRLGKDLLFNCSNENHRMGLRWLQRHLGEEYRVHEIDIADYHVDSCLIPLKPGTLLLHKEVDTNKLPAPLRKWDRVICDAPFPVNTPDTGDESVPLLASQNIGMNVLSLNEREVVVQDIQVELIQSLEQAGFTPIPCRWRHGRTLGGGFHCVTLDIRRRSVLEDYFS